MSLNNASPSNEITENSASVKEQVNMISAMTKGFRVLLIISVIATIIAVLLNFLTPQIFRFTVDFVLDGKDTQLPAFLQNLLDALGGRDFLRQNIVVCALAIVICSVLSGMSNYLCRITIAKASEGMVCRLRDQLFAHIQKLPFRWHVDHQTGDIIQRCTSDVDMLRNFLSGQLLEVFRTVFLIAVALVLMFSMNVKLSLIATCFIPIVMAYSGIFAAQIAKRFKVADEAEGSLSATVQENFTGVRVVRAFGREAFEIERFTEKNNTFASLWIHLGHLLSYYWSIGDLVSNLQVLAIIVVGILECVAGTITLGEFLVFVSYNFMLVWPVRSMGRILSEMSKTGVSIARINEILLASEEEDSKTSITPPMDGDIVFNNVCFDYHGGNPVVKDVSFKIKSGTTFGILGGTGSGKSTLMTLLDRLYDLPEDSGSITIGGVDIRNIKRDWLRKNIGFVLQEPFLFSKTIGENIGISHGHEHGPEECMESIRKCASIAAVDDAISEFTHGYDTVVGERGVTLSGGQKQRVAIARMLMQQAPIMVFDDSLSAVDAETDSKIRHSLKSGTGNSTVILISHRITTLMHADCIMVLENGRVAQMGSHNDLKEQEGIYRQIYQMQGALELELQENISAGGEVNA